LMTLLNISLSFPLFWCCWDWCFKYLWALKSAQSAIVSALIYNALIIPALIPVALKGVKFLPLTADQLLKRNIFIYGVGGIIAPFIAIKLIDVILPLN
ncbi:hypothetical protein OA07_26415, partial [Aphanizomenon flos-aquae 2012/KM1/D3]